MSVPPPAVVEPLRSPKTLPVAARQVAMSWYFLLNQLPESERALGWVIPKLWRDWSPGYGAEEDLAHVFESLSGPGRRRAALRYYRNTWPGRDRRTCGDGTGAPALYLHGEDDGCAQVAIGVRAGRLLPQGSRFESVAGVGHFLHLEDRGHGSTC